MNTITVGMLVAGAILIVAGIKGVGVKQVVKDSVSSVKGGKEILINEPSVKTPNTGGNPNIATGR